MEPHAPPLEEESLCLPTPTPPRPLGSAGHGQARRTCLQRWQAKNLDLKSWGRKSGLIPSPANLLAFFGPSGVSKKLLVDFSLPSWGRCWLLGVLFLPLGPSLGPSSALLGPSLASWGIGLAAGAAPSPTTPPSGLGGTRKAQTNSLHSMQLSLHACL